MLHEKRVYIQTNLRNSAQENQMNQMCTFLSAAGLLRTFSMLMRAVISAGDSSEQPADECGVEPL